MRTVRSTITLLLAFLLTAALCVCIFIHIYEYFAKYMHLSCCQNSVTPPQRKVSLFTQKKQMLR